MSAADRQRRYRARQRNGVAVVPVEIDEDVFWALAISKYLPEAEHSDNRKVSAVLRRVIREWSVEKFRYALQLSAQPVDIVTSS